MKWYLKTKNNVERVKNSRNNTDRWSESIKNEELIYKTEN